MLPCFKPESIKTNWPGMDGEVICAIGDRQVREAARDWNITRAAAAVRLFASRLTASVVAIGNAPTALF